MAEIRAKVQREKELAAAAMQQQMRDVQAQAALVGEISVNGDSPKKIKAHENDTPSVNE